MSVGHHRRWRLLCVLRLLQVEDETISWTHKEDTVPIGITCDDGSCAGQGPEAGVVVFSKGCQRQVFVNVEYAALTAFLSRGQETAGRVDSTRVAGEGGGALFQIRPERRTSRPVAVETKNEELCIRGVPVRAAMDVEM